MFKLLKILPLVLLLLESEAFATVNVAVIAPGEGKFALLGE